MYLIRDVLDQQIIDVHETKGGKVDGIALEVRDGEAPRVAFLETGAEPRSRRLGILRFRKRVAEPFRVAWDKVEHIGENVILDIDVTKTAAYRLENWLRENIVKKIPGNAHHKHQKKND